MSHHAVTDASLDYGFIDVNTQIGPAHGEAGGAPAELGELEKDFGGAGGWFVVRLPAHC